MSETGTERTTHTLTGVQTWRQVGWIGQSGAFYSLSEPIEVVQAGEPGSYSPLWFLAWDERVDLGDEAASE
jgi:hypothetical protein